DVRLWQTAIWRDDLMNAAYFPEAEARATVCPSVGCIDKIEPFVAQSAPNSREAMNRHAGYLI
ncbi:MAG: hypothetical protein Q7S17_00540, partial [Xanthobacteraceae bacterium]|nr:hypothetical protein [Xanthobacteraceae bacterium]